MIKETFGNYKILRTGVLANTLSISCINMLEDDSGRTMEAQIRENAEFLLTVPRASTNLEISIC